LGAGIPVRFFEEKSSIPKNCEGHFGVFKNYCVRIRRMLEQCDKGLFTIDALDALTPDTFNTSYPKIMDNVIMAFVMSVDKPKKKRQPRIKAGN
jgi:hypothetical protein